MICCIFWLSALQLTAEGKADRGKFRQYLCRIYHEDNDVFQYLSDEEVDILRSRWKVFANFTKSISLIRHGKDKLYDKEYRTTIEMFIDAILDYLFE